MVARWKDMTAEMLTELALAREALSCSPSEAVQTRYLRGANAPRKTWSAYCRDIGISKSTVNRWLALYFGKQKELATARENLRNQGGRADLGTNVPKLAYAAKEAALCDAQDVADILLDAECRLGEILARRPEEVRSSRGGNLRTATS